MYRVLTWELSVDQLSIVQACLPPGTEAEVLSDLTDWQGSPPALLLAGDKSPRFADFSRWSTQQVEASGVQPRPVLLFLSPGSEEDPAIWPYHDGIVTEDNLSRLEMLLDCPFILDAEETARSVPASFLQRLLLSTAADLALEEIPFVDMAPAEGGDLMRHHLARCALCRLAFDEQLEMRLAMMQQVYLAAVSRPAFHLWLARAPRRTQKLMRNTKESAYSAWHSALEALAPSLIDIQPGPAPADSRLASLTARFDATGLRERLTDLGRDYAKRVSRNKALPFLYAALQQGVAVPTKSNLGTLKIQIKEKTLIVGASKTDFRLQMHIDDDTAMPLLSLESRNGQVVLPLIRFNEALMQGACRLILIPVL